MSSLIFMGWVGDDAVKVLKAHFGSAVDSMNFSDKDLVLMNQNIVKLRTIIKKNNFKSLNIKVINEETNPTYILHLGKSYSHKVDNTNTSMFPIPLILINSSLNYQHLVKNKKIKKTKFPQLYNNISGFTANDDSDDSLDKTENLSKIIKKKQSKSLPMPDYELSYEDNVEPPELSNSTNTDIPPKSNQENSTKRVQFENEEAESEELDDFLNSESNDESKEKKEDDVLPPSVKSSKSSKSRKQLRQELIDDAEESRWEPL